MKASLFILNYMLEEYAYFEKYFRVNIFFLITIEAEDLFHICNHCKQSVGDRLAKV